VSRVVKLGLLFAVLVNAVAAPSPNYQLQELVQSGSLSDLRWPNFTRFQPDVARFYESNG